ncbi:glycosyltransferase [Megamonas funiformis]|uniref:glycosyltransferase n=1 Tax=Megamonas funiformis TaxID=437897 RepID=UPI00399A60C4
MFLFMKYDKIFFCTLPQKDYWSIAMYFRFILPIILKRINTLFYVDADTLCLKECNKFFDINLKDNVIGAVLDVKKSWKKKRKSFRFKEKFIF